MEQKPLYPYSVVEGALAVFFEIRPKGQPALRSRIRNLQRLGMKPENAGASKRTEYTRYDVYDLALALSLAEFGVDPMQVMASGVKNAIKDFDTAHVWNVNDWVCVYTPMYFSAGMSEVRFVPLKIAKKYLTSMPRIAIINVADLMKRVDQALL